MTQNWTDDVFASGHVGQTDLQNMENNFGCLKSGFFGASSPANPVAGMRWDRRLRNSDNSAWLAFLTGDAAQKIWIYRNDSVEGWAIDATVTDVCLAFKGGSQAYNVNGGTIAGTWTVGGLTTSHTHAGNSHNHKWYNNTGAGDDQSYNSGGSAISIAEAADAGHGLGVDSGLGASNLSNSYYTANGGTSSSTGGVSDGGIASNAIWRARAAVGTMQYPDI